MADRRAHIRFEVLAPWHGVVQILRDVTVERRGPGELVALMQSAAVVGEHMTLELTGSGEVLAPRVRVEDSRPVIIENGVRHQVRLALTDEERGAADGRTVRAGTPRRAPTPLRSKSRRAADTLDTVLRAADLSVVLRREIPVQVIDISASGCLLDSTRRLLIGAAGSIAVRLDASDYADEIRVVRCREWEGLNGRYVVGAEFLWTSAPHDGSLRRVVSRLQAGTIRGAATHPAGLR